MIAIITVVFLVLLGVILISVSIGLRVVESHRRKQVEGLVSAVEGSAPSPPPTENPLLMPSAQALKALGGTSGLRWLGRLLQQAGLSWTPLHLISLSAVLAIAGAALGWYLRPLGFLWLSAICLFVVFGFAPYAWVRSKRNHRLGAIEEQLPEALEFLARSMRAGHAFSISLEMLGQELPAPLGQEFRALFQELNLGASTEAALHNLSVRVPLLDVRLFVSSVLLQKQTGGNLSEILVQLAHVIRERFRLRGQVRVASAHGRLTALVLTLLPVFLVLALMLIAPEYLQSLAADPQGKWLIAGAFGAQLLGYYIMHRIVDIKV